jgi:TolB-like protein/Tfp pilus assembly protein PilF
MSELRHVLGDDFERPRIVETIRKRGYGLIAPVEGLEAMSEPRLSVLPFEYLNRDPDHDYFAAGISDALTTELGNVAGLQVISRQSVLALMCTPRTIGEIARTLRVDAVLEGSALHAGDRVRITAQLIQTAPERHLWAQSYVSEMGDILQLQGRVAHAVAEAVQVQLTPNEVACLTRPRTVQPKAHLAYLKARHQALRWDRGGLEKGFGYLRQALRIDPDYAPAHTLFALAFAVLGYWGFLPVEVAYPKAMEAAELAVRLDRSLGEAHAILGLMRWLMSWDFDGCEVEMRKAIERNPSSELAHAFFALFLAVSRQNYDEATKHTRLILDLDPLSMSTGFFAAWLYFFSRSYARAREQAQATLDVYSDCLHAHYVVGWTALAEERHCDAITAFERAAALSRDAVSVGYLAMSHARAGRADDARGLLSELRAMRDAGEVPEYVFALVYAGLDDTDAALESLERCYAARDSRIFWFDVPAIGGSLRRQVRFREFMRRVEEAVAASSTGAAVPARRA